MTQESNGSIPGSKRVEYTFALPKDQENDFLHVVAWWRGARVEFKWMDDGDKGTRALNALLNTMPQVVTAVREERSIRREVRDMDRDIDNLLNGDGE